MFESSMTCICFPEYILKIFTVKLMNTTGVLKETGTLYPLWATVFVPVFSVGDWVEHLFSLRCLFVLLCFGIFSLSSCCLVHNVVRVSGMLILDSLLKISFTFICHGYFRISRTSCCIQYNHFITRLHL